MIPVSKSDVSATTSKKAKTTAARNASKGISDAPEKAASSRVMRSTASKAPVVEDTGSSSDGPPAKPTKVARTKNVSAKGKAVAKAAPKVKKENKKFISQRKDTPSVDDHQESDAASSEGVADAPPRGNPSPKKGKASGNLSAGNAAQPTEPRYEGDYAWFDAYADNLKSVCPRSQQTPGPAEYTAIHAKLASLLASDPSHRSCFTIKMGYKGPPATFVGPKVDDWDGNLADSILMRGAHVKSGYIGEIEFDEDEIPAFYDWEVDLSSVQGFQARLEVPPSSGTVCGSGNLKLRRVWQSEEDPEKQLFEGWWDMKIEPDNQWARFKKGFDGGHYENAAVIWAVKHIREKTDDIDEDDEYCEG